MSVEYEFGSLGMASRANVMGKVKGRRSERVRVRVPEQLTVLVVRVVYMLQPAAVGRGGQPAVHLGIAFRYK